MEMKCRAAGRVRLERDITAVIDNNAPTDRQAKTTATSLGCIQRRERIDSRCEFEPVAVIDYLEIHLVAIGRNSDLNHRRVGLETIADQIQQHLPNLIAVVLQARQLVADTDMQ